MLPSHTARWLLALGLLAFPIRDADADAEDRWARVAPPGAGFRVEMPGTPRRESRDHWTPLGRPRAPVLAGGGRAELGLEMHDVPALPAAWTGHDRVLDRTRAGVVDHARGTLLESRVLTWDGAPAREFVYRRPGPPERIERVRAVLVGSRLYLLSGASRDARQHPGVARFFTSFGLLPAVGAGPGARP